MHTSNFRFHSLVLAWFCFRTFWAVAEETPPTARQVHQWIGQLNESGSNSRTPALTNLMALGTNAYPYLAFVLSRRDGIVNRLYMEHWHRLPTPARQLFTSPESKDQLRAKAAAGVNDLGPAACRALCGVICDELDDPVERTPVASSFLLRALAWSLPESPRAVRTLTNYLANPDNYLLFGTTKSLTLWSNLPTTVPYLTAWLRRPDGVREAASALATMGSNALPAVPALIEVAELGVAGRPANLKFRIGYTPNLAPIRMNRMAAMSALVALKADSPGALGVLRQAATDPDLETRVAAIRALGYLQPEVGSPYLKDLTGDLPPRRTYQFANWVGEISKLGKTAEPVLNWLEPLVDPQVVARLPAAGPGNEFALDAQEFRRKTLMALGRIDPERLRRHLKEFVSTSGPVWELPDYLPSIRPLAGDLKPLLRANLASPDWPTAGASAIALLRLDPTDAKARGLLEDRMKSGPRIEDRWQAAFYLWKGSGEVTSTLPFYIEMLESGSPEERLTPVWNGLLQMGTAARDAAPVLLRLLNDQDPMARDAAGDGLKAVAPDLLPPIVGGE